MALFLTQSKNDEDFLEISLEISQPLSTIVGFI